VPSLKGTAVVSAARVGDIDAPRSKAVTQDATAAYR